MYPGDDNVFREVEQFSTLISWGVCVMNEWFASVSDAQIRTISVTGDDYECMSLCVEESCID